MLYLYYGNDSDKARAKLNTALEKNGAGTDVFRITDAHTLADLEAALMGGGMFGGAVGEDFPLRWMSRVRSEVGLVSRQVNCGSGTE